MTTIIPASSSSSPNDCAEHQGGCSTSCGCCSSATEATPPQPSCPSEEAGRESIAAGESNEDHMRREASSLSLTPSLSRPGRIRKTTPTPQRRSIRRRNSTPRLVTRKYLRNFSSPAILSSSSNSPSPRFVRHRKSSSTSLTSPSLCQPRSESTTIRPPATRSPFTAYHDRKSQLSRTAKITTTMLINAAVLDRAASTGGGDSVSRCSSSYYTELTVDDDGTSHHNHRSHDDNSDDYEEYVIEEREEVLDETTESEVETDDVDDDSLSASGLDSKNSLDSSDDDGGEASSSPSKQQQEQNRRASSLGELSAHTLSTAFTLNDLESIETVSSLDMDIDDDDEEESFGLDDDDEPLKIGHTKRFDSDYYRRQQPNPHAGGVVNVDDSSLDTADRERRRMDKHTEAHELREVFCLSPSSKKSKKSLMGSRRHRTNNTAYKKKRRRRHSLSHPTRSPSLKHDDINLVGIGDSNLDGDRNRGVSMSALLRSMHKSLTISPGSTLMVSCSDEMDGGIGRQRFHSFDAATTSTVVVEDAPQDLDAAKKFLSGLATLLKKEDGVQSASVRNNRGSGATMNDHEPTISYSMDSSEYLEVLIYSSDDDKDRNGNDTPRYSTGSASSYYEEEIIEEEEDDDDD